MGKKKRKDGIDEPKIAKVYCYYCERIFEDEKVLIMHQKSRHFKCNFCNKKLSTASGMVVHVAQVHKETILTVPNAKPGRDSVEVEVYGMEGVPGYSKVDNDPNKRARLETPTLFPRPPVAAYPMQMHYPVAPPVVMGPPRGPPMGFPMRPPPPPPHLLMRGPPPMMMPPHMAFPPGVVPPHMMAPPPLAAAMTSAPDAPTSTASKDEEAFEVVLAAPQPGITFVFPEDNMSMEEKRALLPKYRTYTKAH
ncbi:hypothetical protein SPRG_10071 [Saprolegnia parasitica CBS 223.65]|uniref:C2H2-type domain-containing protein n=1 Tax=Saprolegnia parasitica (strain CBS 223.65) TaxID=695850 RepID=A0A067C456_SAPPC|nr:hypothetical protein SPRG_10071 [Saprolegnia parasitica CBS 223.65]KDO23925.1 hypothetical protein SPRG_10071 [Saprolegnia parasitica CBS 223.65]|eukprot:XP_012205391.1 hypothetical protein SPRG_10071 [Saprolegnia parasitica CBS 223.65]